MNTRREKDLTLLQRAPRWIEVVIGLGAGVIAVSFLSLGIVGIWEAVTISDESRAKLLASDYVYNVLLVTAIGMGMFLVAKRLLTGEPAWTHRGLFSPWTLKIIGVYLAIRGAISTITLHFLIGEGLVWFACSGACFALAQFRRESSEGIDGRDI